MNRLILSIEIYPLSSIKAAINCFSDIATIHIEKDNDAFICTFNMIKTIPVEICIAEFENYLIDYINSEKQYETD